MKNPHAVALGRLGGAKGGHARAKVLSAERRQQIASKAGEARARALSSLKRKEIARHAAVVRWARPAIVTGLDAPETVRRLLKTYDPSDLIWERPDDRYAIVREILVRGEDKARRWLRMILRRSEVRELVRQYRGAGCSEPERRKLRNELALTSDDIPVRPYLGFQWRRGA